MDLNVQAFRLVEVATGEVGRILAKRAASRKGGLKGGAARAKSISPVRRVKIAQTADGARWRNKDKKPPTAV
jgi:hypothetical protein